MTIFIEADVSDSEGSHPDNQIQGLKNWISYAAENNPETTFFVGLPWLGRPLEYVGETEDPQTSGYEEYETAILESEAAVQDVTSSAVRSTRIFLLAYGQGSLERRRSTTGQPARCRHAGEREGRWAFTRIRMVMRSSCSRT